MDSRLKERLIGAAVLVVLAAWLIPWVLDGPADAPQSAEGALELPAAAESAPIRSQTIRLDHAEGAPVPAVASVAPAGAREAPTAQTPEPAASAAQQDTARAAPAAADGAGSRAGTADEPPARHVLAAGGEPRAPAGSEAAGTSAPDTAPVPKAADAQPAAERPAAPAAKPPAAKPPASGAWVVQLGSFGEPANAKRLADRVATFGYEAHVSDFRSGGRLLHRVRLGPHGTRGEAEAVASSLSAHGFPAQVVTAN